MTTDITFNEDGTVVLSARWFEALCSSARLASTDYGNSSAATAIAEDLKDTWAHKDLKALFAFLFAPTPGEPHLLEFALDSLDREYGIRKEVVDDGSPKLPMDLLNEVYTAEYVRQLLNEDGRSTGFTRP